MLRVFKRASARANLKIQYTQGFNPRPRLSLPLPRSVGVEVDEDLLCIRLADEPQMTNLESQIKARLLEQLPNSLSIVDCQLAAADAKSVIPRPFRCTYVMTVRQEYIDDKLNERIGYLLERESIMLERRIPKSGFKSKTKNIDIRGFLRSIKLADKNIIVECNISPAGSIRVDEILKLLDMDIEKLAAPIKRTNVQWQH